jgi:hypothetical protein
VRTSHAEDFTVYWNAWQTTKDAARLQYPPESRDQVHGTPGG